MGRYDIPGKAAPRRGAAARIAIVIDGVERSVWMPPTIEERHRFRSECGMSFPQFGALLQSAQDDPTVLDEDLMAMLVWLALIQSGAKALTFRRLMEQIGAGELTYDLPTPDEAEADDTGGDSPEV